MIKEQKTKKYNLYIKKIFHYLTILKKWFFKIDPVTAFTGVLSLVAVIHLLAFIQSEQAFVYPTTANFTAGKLLANMKDTRLSIFLKNSGKGTAIIEECYAAIIHDLNPKPNYKDAANIAGGDFTIPPVPAGMDVAYPVDFGSRSQWHEVTTKEVQDGKRGFYFYGKFKYRVQVSYKLLSFLFPVRESGFCFKYDYLSSEESHSPIFRNCIEREYTYTK